jgi:PDZ domain
MVVMTAVSVVLSMFPTTMAFLMAPPTNSANFQSPLVPQSSSLSKASSRFRTPLSMALTYDQVVSRVVSYDVAVPKPLGIIFGENPEPYFGLVVDDVSEGMNGGKAGLRVGDQLLAINGQVVVGKDFDTVMSLLQQESTVLDLVLYRGPVRQLFTILGNQLQEGESIQDDDEDEDDESEVIIMDENYESPVRIEVKEEKPLTPGDVVKAFGKLGSMMAESLKGDNTPSSAPKKKSGFFGIGAESIQLDGDEAKGYKDEKPKSE